MLLQNPLSTRIYRVQWVAFSVISSHLFYTFILTAKFGESYKQISKETITEGIEGPAWLVYRCLTESVQKVTLKLSVSVFQGGDLTGWTPHCFSKNLGNFVLH